LKKFKNTNKLYKGAKHQVCIFQSGYQHIVDIDLKGFFDEVDHLFATAKPKKKPEISAKTALRYSATISLLSK